jgi:hypothetical protein
VSKPGTACRGPAKSEPRQRQSKFKSNANGAQLKLAATLRSRTAGSQDESPCRAIHKFKSYGNSVMLDLCVHTAYYVVHCDVADWPLGAVNYCQAAEVVFVENFEDIFVVGVGRY